MNARQRPCSRPTLAGAECKLPAMFWHSGITLPDPQSCRQHLTAGEAAAYKDDKPRREAEWFPFEFRWYLFLTSDPACWSWEPPVSLEFALLMKEWQDGRCAVCGCRGPLVNDHDHRTGWQRGYLCYRCNTLEGVGHGGVFEKYRQRNPASICGVQEPYWNPFAREYAKPAPPPGDPWKNNPMKGIGL